MRKLDNIDILGPDGKPVPPNVKKELVVLLASFDLCVNGNGLPYEAMEIARVLSAFFAENKVSCKPGYFFPDWPDALVKFYLANGMIKMAVEAATIRGRPLDVKELDIYRLALVERKAYQAQCLELAEMLSQTGMIVQAAAAAKLAGQNLPDSSLNSIRQQIIMGNPNLNCD
ncbi:MAG: hypothetical protein NTX14_02000 [Candidatus Nealsonbacteria bacterium]|jgi:hypothetical protein|nr:hypothetical protein [Candidatus Nealsonbacteria bacterium]